MTATLHYIFDPLCGWCYAASPLVRRVADELQESVAVQLHPGLLFETPMSLKADWRQHILQADQQIHALSGVRFGDAYIARIRTAESVILASSLPAAAVLAAEQLQSGAGLDMLESIQIAHYVNGENVCEMPRLRALAAALDLPSEAFGAALDHELTQQAATTRHARDLLQASGGQGYPTFVLQIGEHHIRLPHARGYGQPQTFIDQINQSIAREHP
ncbi:MAG TPA: DsbA family protein [Rhodocyclaceae bacterium]|nr:DsbA family protein [Rhodocyclaceae bacterium]